MALQLFTDGGRDAETALISSILERHGFSYSVHDLTDEGEPARFARRMAQAGRRVPPPALLVGKRTLWTASDMPPMEQSGELQRALAAARQAHRARSEYRWGVACLEGRGAMRRDPFEAIDWLRKSARRGDPKGMAALATLLVRGDAGVVDESEASRWYEDAAKRGKKKPSLLFPPTFLACLSPLLLPCSHLACISYLTGNHSALLALGSLRLAQVKAKAKAEVHG